MRGVLSVGKSKDVTREASSSTEEAFEHYAPRSHNFVRSPDSFHISWSTTINLKLW